MKILLLVQANSRCIELLSQAIKEKLTINDALYVWEINNVYFSDDKSSISDGHEQLSVKDISLVVKRTWGPIRQKGLIICKSLEDMGVTILNGCDFIAWSHSKIQQYTTLAQQHKADLLPKTICVHSVDIEKFINQTAEHNLAKHILEQLHPDYKFPIILKKDKGTRADGVYLIDSLDTLQGLLVKELESLRKGFLFQEFIPSHTNAAISNYYRINIVSNKAQSAVQFQLIWKKMEGCVALKLVDFPGANQIPIDLAVFPEKRLQEIVNACPYQQDVVGIDVMFNQGQMYLLEYNDGSAIGLIVDIGEKYLNSETPEQVNAAKACYDFAKSNADTCLKLVSPDSSNDQQMTNKIDIQRYIENVSTNPRWGQDPSQIEFTVFHPGFYYQDSENFLITSRIARDEDPESLYYKLIFRDVSLKEWQLQLTPIVSIKEGVLKVLPNGEMKILNNDFQDSTREILPVNNSQSSEWLAYFRIQYRLQKFTDAEFKFVNGRLAFTNGFHVPGRQDEESSNVYALASLVSVGSAVYLYSKYRARNRL